MSNLRDEIVKLLDFNPDVKTGGVGQDLIDDYADRLIALFNKHIGEARLDELQKLKQQDKYPFFSDEAERYVENRLRELGETR